MNDGFLRKFAESIIRKLFWIAPWGVREIFFNAYLDINGTIHVFRQLAIKSKVKSIVIRGSYGDICGSPSDASVLSKYAITGTWAERTNQLLEDFFDEKGGGTYIDIGANIGLTTIPISTRSDVRCYCFEPEPTNYSYLVENIRKNCKHQNVTTYNLAIYHEESELVFEKSPHNYGDHRIRLGQSISKLDENNWETIKVAAVPLAQVISEIKKPLAVKIDTQGAEPYVILGGNSLLLNADLIILEFSPYMMMRMGSDPKIILTFVKLFPKVAVALGESASVQTYVSGQEAALILETFLKENLEKSVGGYCDVICRSNG